jgi:hypothetical protein
MNFEDQEVIELVREYMPHMSNCTDLVGRADNCFDYELTHLVVEGGKCMYHCYNACGVSCVCLTMVFLLRKEPTKQTPEQVFSYELDGEDAFLLGEGDLHGVPIQKLEKSFALASMADDLSTHSGVYLNSDYCPFTIWVYPTPEMEDFYTSQRPVLYALMIVATLAFAAIVFLTYDKLVTVRQHTNGGCSQFFRYHEERIRSNR